MEIKYQFEIVDEQNNSKTPLKDGNKKWVAVDEEIKYLDEIYAQIENADYEKGTDENYWITNLIAKHMKKLKEE